MIPLPAQASGALVKLLLQLMLPQSSEAIAFPCADSQSDKALGEALQSMVMSVAGVMAGGVISSMIKFAVVVSALAQASITMNRTESLLVLPHPVIELTT